MTEHSLETARSISANTLLDILDAAGGKLELSSSEFMRLYSRHILELTRIATIYYTTNPAKDI